MCVLCVQMLTASCLNSSRAIFSPSVTMTLCSAEIEEPHSEFIQSETLHSHDRGGKRIHSLCELWGPELEMYRFNSFAQVKVRKYRFCNVLK